MPKIFNLPQLKNKIVFCKDKTGIFFGNIILCNCCNTEFSPSKWERHTGSTRHRPWQSICLQETGKNLLYYKDLYDPPKRPLNATNGCSSSVTSSLKGPFMPIRNIDNGSTFSRDSQQRNENSLNSYRTSSGKSFFPSPSSSSSSSSSSCGMMIFPPSNYSLDSFIEGEIFQHSKKFKIEDFSSPSSSPQLSSAEESDSEEQNCARILLSLREPLIIEKTN